MSELANELQVGRGIADITGEPWGVGMMGYGMPFQWTQGILTRQYARAFVLKNDQTQIAYVVADVGMFFQAAVDAIHERLSNRFGEKYTRSNVVLTATHTHCGPGGHGRHLLYNISTKGFHRRTFDRLVDGVVDAIAHADHDTAPSTATLNQTSLTTASVNRSHTAFDRNPDDERAFFPDRIDPLSTLLRFERGNDLIGAVNWFAVHNTSMSNKNNLISSDNKGWAARRWEDDAPAGFVAAFAQTNAGDISPNLGGRASCGPTDDDRQNNRIIGERQLQTAQGLVAEAGEVLSSQLHHAMNFVDLDQQQTDAGPTGSAVLGASFAAGTSDGLGSSAFREGKQNPVVQRASDWLYRRFPRIAVSHAPKDLLLPVGRLRWVQQVLPVQFIGIGSLYLICLPVEVTIAAGLRLRRAVADVMSTDVQHVLVQGYANGYAHYLTTPEEYDEQRYEGGSTVFGRNELAAFLDATRSLAIAVRDGSPVESGTPPPRHRLTIPALTGSPRLAGRRPLAVRSAPASATAGTGVVVEFDADHPNALLRPTYLSIGRECPTGWEIVADDSSLSTEITWRRDSAWNFVARVTWQVPADAAGNYQISYIGHEVVTTGPIAVTPTSTRPR